MKDRQKYQTLSETIGRQKRNKKHVQKKVSRMKNRAVQESEMIEKDE